VLSAVNRSSSPGYPWVSLGTTNGQVLDNYLDAIKDAVEKRLLQMSKFKDDIRNMTPEDLVELNICDPIKLFIKQEPHKLKKIVSGKLRLISSVSLVDQIVVRFLCRRQNNAEIETWESCPSKPGLGLNDEGLQVIAETARQMLKRGTVAMTDVSGWDWSVQQWELDADADCRAKLAGAEDHSLFHKLLRAHAWCVGNPVFVIPDGSVWAQTFSGKQLSGDYNTSSTNSRMRVLASLVARQAAGHSLDGPIDICAMGDDSFELEFDGLKDCLEEIGHSVRMVETTKKLEGLEFCSMEFREDGSAVPVNLHKTLYRFLTHKDSPDYPSWMAQLSYELRHLVGSQYDKVWGVIAARAERAKENLDGEAAWTTTGGSASSPSAIEASA